MRHGVGTVLREQLKDRVLTIERKYDRVIIWRLDIEGEV